VKRTMSGGGSLARRLTAATIALAATLVPAGAVEARGVSLPNLSRVNIANPLASIPGLHELADLPGVLDSAVDVVTANAGSSTVSVLLNNGDATFRSTKHPPRAIAPFTPALGDFAGRGMLDLAVGDSGTSRVAVRRGNGDGTFGAPTTYRVGLVPWWLTAADISHDGRIDIVTGNGVGASISVLVNDGAGGFATAVDY